MAVETATNTGGCKFHWVGAASICKLWSALGLDRLLHTSAHCRTDKRIESPYHFAVVGGRAADATNSKGELRAILVFVMSQRCLSRSGVWAHRYSLNHIHASQKMDEVAVGKSHDLTVLFASGLVSGP